MALGTYGTGKWSATGLAGVSIARHSSASATAVVVSVLGDAEKAARRITGPAFRVSRADGKGAAPGIDLAVDKAPLGAQFGADYASRVRWAQRPDTPLSPPTGDRVTGGSRTTAPPQPPRIVQSSVLMIGAAAPAAANGTGNFAATSLSPSASWQVSAQTGSFSWNYPLRVPPLQAGPTPNLALAYDSGSVDGETGSTNNQPSAVGDGWSLSGGGFIERSYAGCDTDGVAGSADQCWKSDNATMSFAGHSGRIVRDSSSGDWHLESDDGSRIEKLTGAANGDGGTAVDGVGEYWKVTTVDGTQYFFGLNHLPGWVAGNAETNSAWTIPVFGNTAGEPCYNPTFANAFCTQAWRWNLDYVLTPHNSTETFYYAPETNRYSRDGATAVSYVRGGQLARIDYGTAGASALTTAAPARVVFDLVDRCIPGSVCDTAHPGNWPDVPWDQQCNAGACTGQVSPTFFSTKMLATVHTQILNAGAYTDVDTWRLTHSFPPPNDTTSPALWLARISHTGTAASGVTASLPDVVFGGTPMQNRVLVVDGSALLWKYRITTVSTESGARIAVGYSAQDCSATALPAPESNSKRCYPQWWSPPGQYPALDWFNKYVVTEVSTDPVTGGYQPTDDTYYDYTGTPGWRYNSSPMTPVAKRTWSDFAGYSRVRVRHGSDSTPSSQETTTYSYYQGLDGDRLNRAGGSKSVTVAASDGSSVADSLWLAGRVRESTTSNGNGGARNAPVPGARISNTINTPWASAPTASDGTYTARMTGDGLLVTRTSLAAGGDRTTQTSLSHDAHGRVTSTNDLGDVSTAADDKCSTTSYADNAASWLLDLPSQVTVVGKACGSAAIYPQDAISDTRTYYDGSGTLGAAPVRGDATRVDIVNAYAGSTAATAQWQTATTTTYDDLGRPLSVTDPRLSPARTSTTSYVPAGAGLTTQITSTNPMGWSTVTDLDPRWGAPLRITDPNDHVTETSYDPLGRRVQVWLPERPKASNPTPSIGYAYAVSNTAPTTVATTTLTPADTTLTSYTLYDGLLRPRQTQADAEGGGRDITDTLYDGAGRVVTTNSVYYTPGTPGGALFVPATAIPGQISTGYDGAGRKIYDAQWVNNAEVWRTSYSYGGDHVDLTPPAGGTPSTTWTDARGNTTKLAQYNAATPVGAYDATTYSYNAAGTMASMSDPGGNLWTWSYDVLGHQTAAHDPDKGNTSNSYDAAGRLTATTDADGNTLAYGYDTLGRKTGLYNGSTAGTQLAGWSYDTLADGTAEKGLPATSTRYLNGAAFATTTINAYDAADRVRSQKMTIASGVMAGIYTSSTAYTPDGQVSYIGRSAAGGFGGDGVSYGYDALGNLATATGPNFASYVSATTYSAIGQVVKYQDAIGRELMSHSFSYADGTGRLLTDLTMTNFSGNPVAASHSYTYNNAGLVTQDQNAVAAVGTDTQCFNYDHLQRLSAAWTPAGGDCAAGPSSAGLGGPAPYWQSYGYDNVGNRTSVTRHASAGVAADQTSNYAYPASGAAAVRPHAVTSVAPAGVARGAGDYGYGYDGLGNTTSRPGGQQVSYDSEGRLASVVSGSGTQSDVYDADGNRLLQTDSTGTTLYLGDTEYHAAAGSTVVSATRTYRFWASRS
ncbi:MAG TPA: hypothetical protein VGH11_00945, partial [Jatrophihabitans sp.]